MTRIIWAPQAIEDIEAIQAYVARDSRHSAELLVERLVSAVSRLETNPLSGRVVPEVGDEILREVTMVTTASSIASGLILSRL